MQTGSSELRDWHLHIYLVLSQLLLPLFNVLFPYHLFFHLTPTPLLSIYSLYGHLISFVCVTHSFILIVLFFLLLFVEL